MKKTVPAGRQGFTLIEIVIAICIFSAVAGLISFRSAGTVEQIKLRTASRQIASDLRLIQSKALSEKSETEAVFFREYYLLQGKTVKLPSKVWVFDPHAIKFSRNGTPVVGFFSAIELRCGKKSASIIISPQGRIRIE